MGPITRMDIEELQKKVIEQEVLGIGRSIKDRGQRSQRQRSEGRLSFRPAIDEEKYPVKKSKGSAKKYTET